MTTAADLIARSVSHAEIAHAAWTGDLQRALLVACDDWTENGDVIEYWGADDEGRKWRVHLDAERKDESEEPADDARTYIAVAGQDRGTCEALGWAALSIRPFVLATGDDEDEVLDRAIKSAGHDDIHVHEVA